MCACSHLTNFAAITTGGGKGLSARDAEALDYITYIGLGISLPCMAAMALHFLVATRLRTYGRFVLANLALSLGAGLALFVLGANATGNAGESRKAAKRPSSSGSP